MNYRLIIKPSAEREIDSLQRSLQPRILKALARIQQDPHGNGTIKLAGTKSAYRFRVGDWRIVYELDDSTSTVFVTIVAHRGDVYR